MPTDVRPADIRSAIAKSMPRAKSELAELVRFRSVHDPRQFPVEECVGAAQWVQRAFVDAGIPDVQLIETSDGSLAVVGSRPAPAGAPTVLLYSHYDVQPPGDRSYWDSEPFELTERDGRWYG
ncbi:MAG: M20/M25/M40 family metallo-hydrolase, partial [Actinobacteria bacterium]|nr:M20/M25/M40 family metallo-hydrolase [Actinomycetota bacterium]